MTVRVEAVSEAIGSRRSVRRFLPTPVPEETVREILRLASNAPSGSNLQPWTVFALAGEKLAALGAAIQGAYLSDEPGHGREYKYYTDELFEPYISRRRACGWGLYGTLGIARGEKERMKTQRAQNYNFFGAPVGLVFTIDRRLEIGSWIDVGGFLQTVMIAARGFGLHTCAQASIAEFPNVVRAQLPVDPNHMVVCGMALGHIDEDALINSFRTERSPVEEFARFEGF